MKAGPLSQRHSSGAECSATLYLRNVAPAYGCVGMGLALNFASQGAKHVLFPVLAGTARMIIAAFVGWSAVVWFGASLSTLFQIVALGSIVYGALTAIAVHGGGWSQSLTSQPLATGK